MKQIQADVIQMREARIWNNARCQTQSYSSTPHLFIYLSSFSSLHNSVSQSFFFFFLPKSPYSTN